MHVQVGLVSWRPHPHYHCIQLSAHTIGASPVKSLRLCAHAAEGLAQHILRAHTKPVREAGIYTQHCTSSCCPHLKTLIIGIQLSDGDVCCKAANDAACVRVLLNLGDLHYRSRQWQWRAWLTLTVVPCCCTVGLTSPKKMASNPAPDSLVTPKLMGEMECSCSDTHK